MKKAVLGTILLALIAIAFNFAWKNLRGIGPAIKPPPPDIQEIPPNAAGLPLTLPPGFSIEIFARNLPGARVMAFDSVGNAWISQTSEGVISLLEIQNAKVTSQRAMIENLTKPHGLAFDPALRTSLFYAEENKISRVSVYSNDPRPQPATLRIPTKIVDLPAGGGHFTRTIGFGPDDRLYVSIGSSCNVCYESDDRRAKIFSMNHDGGDFKEFARGLRNTVFFTWHPETKEMWGTDMGRDLLGDDIPPDEINVIGGPSTSSGKNSSPKNFGWPICYGKNVHDGDFDKNVYLRNPCMDPFETPSRIDIPAHSAPLGLAFVPENSNWPREWQGDLLVAYHGSWNRSVPTGYKVVRHKFDSSGNYEGVEDFITGWFTLSAVKGFTQPGALGRPVDLAFRDGALYISDDKAGVIYRVARIKMVE